MVRWRATLRAPAALPPPWECWHPRLSCNHFLSELDWEIALLGAPRGYRATGTELGSCLRGLGREPERHPPKKIQSSRAPRWNGRTSKLPWDLTACVWQQRPEPEMKLTGAGFIWKWNCQPLSHVQRLATPQTVAYQASLSREFSRQEYWSE